MTVLIYLNGGFNGGGTAFYDVNRELEDEPLCVVTPEQGSIVIFYHTGHLSPYHAGMQLKTSRPEDLLEPPEGADPKVTATKYVIRTDLMYEVADGSSVPEIQLPVSPPYNEKGFTYISRVLGGKPVSYVPPTSDDDDDETTA